MAKFDGILLKAKFRGCLLGCLMGDCLGGPFEGDLMSAGTKAIVQNYFEKLDGPPFQAPYKPYSDDTAMTVSVARTLIEKPPVDYTYMARLFVKEYYKEPKRGYGQNVVEVFNKLRANKFEDVYKPAKEQFNGSGSYGNGGAMRISPIALYFHNNCRAMLHAATKATEITHSNKLGIHGALLQCIAVQQSLSIRPEGKINVKEFGDELIRKMEGIEKDDGLGINDSTPYQNQLKLMQELLSSNKTTDEEVEDQLGNSIAALYSVPTAIYCFLRAQSEIPGIKTDNVFRRTIQYAISLGGDTDTIASMAGAIAGAYLGETAVSEGLKNHCEFREEMVKLADDLYEALQQDNE